MDSVDELRFIFTSPTFIKDKEKKEKREFYIPKLNRENSLYGTEFEIKLRNEMTQKAIARECANWIKDKVVFRSNRTGENMPGFMTVENRNEKVAYMPLNGFTTVDIGCDKGNNAWNPVRIIQRFGRIDRIGSKNSQIQLVNFWPDMDLDEYINLKGRVETRMKISVMTSTGDDDLINPEEKGDLEYRKQQLKRLQEEVVDIEDMSSGISIMDLGLNEFRLDLLEYVKNNGDLDKKPKGMHAVVPATDELPEGVVFILKNINNSVNIDNRNRVHPFYMVYIGVDGEVICDYLNPKKMLDDIRLLCRGKKEPIKELCQRFNEETDDGKDMTEMSELLGEAINSIIDCKEESDIDSLFSAGGTTALISDVSGLDDFELICFLVVK